MQWLSWSWMLLAKQHCCCGLVGSVNLVPYKPKFSCNVCHQAFYFIQCRSFNSSQNKSLNYSWVRKLNYFLFVLIAADSWDDFSRLPNYISLVPRPSVAPVFDRFETLCQSISLWKPLWIGHAHWIRMARFLHTASDQKLEPWKAWERG